MADEMAAEKRGPAVDTASDPTDRRFARRRDATTEWAREAQQKLKEARQLAGAFWRQAVGQVRDLTGGLGARHGKPRPRPGDPVTAEELIDDRSLGARLLGAAVFFVGLVAIGAVALVQLGKLEIPWLEDNALPAATATAGSGIDAASGTSLTEEPSGEQAAGPPGRGSMRRAEPRSLRSHQGSRPPTAFWRPSPTWKARRPDRSWTSVRFLRKAPLRISNRSRLARLP
jgi:hypothetical protein